MKDVAPKNPLEAYFADTGENLSKLADRMGRSPSTLIRAVRGERGKILDLAREVEKATRGRVTAVQFLTICVSSTVAERNA